MDQHSDIATSYPDLFQALPLRPIHNATGYKKAMKVLEQLALQDDMNEDQSDYFTVLSGLVEKYERDRWPLASEKVSVPEILKSFMEDHGMSGSDLGRLLGERTIGHKVLSGKRKLTIDQVRILANHFRVSAELFIH
jgi:HTH-type transcriptional regulator/antitoxin HigA